MLTDEIKDKFKKDTGISLDEISKNPKLLEIFKNRKKFKSKEKTMEEIEKENEEILKKW